MNKSISKISALLICGTLIFTGCANASGATDSQQSSDQASSNIEKNNTIENENNKNQRMRNRPNMFGKVRSIIGNEVVLELIEMPTREATGEKNKKEAKKSAFPINSEGGNGGPGERQGNRELNFTGETATILIPVGVPITTRSSGEVKNLEIADIYEGSMLQIWTDEEENITRVAIMQGR